MSLTGLLVLDRYQRTGDLGALNEAVTSYRRALATIPTGHPNQARYLNNLGDALRILFGRTGELAALTEPREAFADAAASPAASIGPVTNDLVKTGAKEAGLAARQ